MNPRRHLVVMVKVPRAGRVKTRLARDIGAPAAAWWARHQMARLLRRLDDPRWSLYLAVAPDREGRSFRRWPGHLPRLPQGSGTLGPRMARVFRSLPPGPAIIVGADIPGMTPGHIDTAFHLLGGADAVIGPAPDGGYWLIGLARRRAQSPGLFARVRWSTEHARTDTLASLEGLRIAQTDTLADVDELADLAAMRRPG